MNRLTSLIIASCLVFGGLMLPARATADVKNKKTVMTTDAPIKIPSVNKVLPAGKYVIRLFDEDGPRNIVQIFNEREDKIFATVLAIPNYRLKPADKTEFTYWETPSGEPLALRSWFYPGDTYGVEFAYPRKAATDLARQSEHDIPTVYSESQKPAELKEARIGATTPQGEEAELAKDDYSAPE